MKKKAAHIYFLNRRVVLIFFLLANCSFLKAQNLAAIENKVISIYRNIDSLRYLKEVVPHQIVNDSLQYLNKELIKYLLDVCALYPEMLKYDFTKLKKEIGFAVPVSQDNKLRIYSWHNAFWGDKAGCNSVVQYKTADGCAAENLRASSDSNSKLCLFFYEIHDYQIKNNRTVYLISAECSGSDSEITNMLKTFEIEKGTLLQNIPFFKGQNETFTGVSISYDRSLMSDTIFDANGKRRINIMLPSFVFSPFKGKTLYVPLLSKGAKNHQYIVYKFDGNQFVRDKYLVDKITF